MKSNGKKTTVGANLFANEKCPNVDYKWGPYTSKEEAFEYLGEDGLDVLAVSLKVGIIQQDGSNREYWFKHACNSVDDLVPYNQDDEILEALSQISEAISGIGTTIESIDRRLKIEEEKSESEEWDEL